MEVQSRTEAVEEQAYAGVDFLGRAPADVPEPRRAKERVLLQQCVRCCVA